MKSKCITHRCEQLLNHNNTSCSIVRIRYDYQFSNYKLNNNKAWWFDKLQTDYDFNTTYMFPVCSIKFCPFCGKELIDVEETN